MGIICKSKDMTAIILVAFWNSNEIEFNVQYFKMIYYKVFSIAMQIAGDDIGWLATKNASLEIII